jgi:hypothetical protein
MGLHAPSMAIYQFAEHTAAGVVKAAPCRLMAVLIYSGDNDHGYAEFFNDIDSADSSLVKIGARGYECPFVDFTPLGGIQFDTGCYINIDQFDKVYVWLG